MSSPAAASESDAEALVSVPEVRVAERASPSALRGLLAGGAAGALLLLLFAHSNAGAALHASARPARASEAVELIAGNTWAGDAACHCIGIMGLKGRYKYANKAVPLDFGSTCAMWDAITDECRAADAPERCWQGWCYVDPCSCNASVPPRRSELLEGALYQGRPLFYSYATCGEQSQEEAADVSSSGAAVAAACDQSHRPREADWGKAACPCKGVGGILGHVDAGDFSYDAAVGANCSAWDLVANPACAGSDPPHWCSAKWCHVDPCQCDSAALVEPPRPSALAGATFASSGSPVYYSYSTCGAGVASSSQVEIPKELCSK